MSLLLMLGLALAGGLALTRRRRRWGAALLSVAALLLAGVAWGVLPQRLLDGLQGPYAERLEPHWGQRSSVIVLLGAGNTRASADSRPEPNAFALARIHRAAVVHRACHAASVAVSPAAGQTRPLPAVAVTSCRVLVSGGDTGAAGVTEADVYADSLVALGVPRESIVLEERSRNTFENARHTAQLLDGLRADQTVLVTSATHLARSQRYFARFGVGTVAVRADWLRAARNPAALGYNLLLTDIALHEYLGLAQFQVYEALGLNPP